MADKQTASKLQQLNDSLIAQALERSRLFEEAQALTHLGSWEWDIGHTTLTWSDELYRIYGLDPLNDTIDYQTYIAMVHPEDRSFVKQTVSQSIKDGKPFQFEHRIVHRNGAIRHILGFGKVIRDASGSPVKMFGTGQDITDRKTTEIALLDSDQRFKALSSATHDLIYDLDLASRTIWFNDVLESHYGYSKKLTHTTLDWWLDCMHPSEVENLKETYYAMLKGSKDTWSIECQFRKADGNYAIIRNRALILRDQLGKPKRIIGSCLDITQQKQLERAKDEFISLVSHQLRTPLTVIQLYGTMLLDGIAGPLEKEQANYTRKMTDASIRLIKLVGDILNISRFELNRIRVNTAIHNANKLIDDCLNELSPVADSRKATVSFSHNPSVTKCPLDATLFCEIVLNLVGNALRYGRTQGGKVAVSFNRHSRGYSLKVSDNGLGIPAADQAHIFERFYRAQNAAAADSEGSGLGLYMVKLFCEAAGGKVRFSSSARRGTTFYVTFPLSGMQASVAKR